MCADTAFVAGTICRLAHYDTPETNKMLLRAAKTIPALEIGQVTQVSSLLARLTFPHKSASVARHVAESR